MPEDTLAPVRHNLLNTVKEQLPTGKMRPRLCRFEKDSKNSAYMWEVSAGSLGGLTPLPVKPGEKEAAEQLLGQGLLVPTISQKINDTTTWRLIQHFDDVRFGYDANNAIVIFKLAYEGDGRDLVIKTDTLCTPAIGRLKLRIDNGTALVDSPIETTDGRTIHPILLDPQAIELRRRQNVLSPAYS